jgi:hypothetical protein
MRVHIDLWVLDTRHLGVLDTHLLVLHQAVEVLLGLHMDPQGDLDRILFFYHHILFFSCCPSYKMQRLEQRLLLMQLQLRLLLGLNHHLMGLGVEGYKLVDQLETVEVSL